jgi:hypothetical protein
VGSLVAPIPEPHPPKKYDEFLAVAVVAVQVVDEARQEAGGLQLPVVCPATYQDGICQQSGPRTVRNISFWRRTTPNKDEEGVTTEQDSHPCG